MAQDEIRFGKLGEAYRRDLRDIYRFYLTDEQRERLAGMGHFNRFFWISSWLSRNLLRRLSPSRRFLLLVSVFLFFCRLRIDRPDIHFRLDTSYLAAFPVLLVLMLELKDKLLAGGILESAGRFVEGEKPHDDQSILVLRRTRA